MDQPQSKSLTPSPLHQLYANILEHRYGGPAENTNLNHFRLLIGSDIILDNYLGLGSLSVLLGLSPRIARSVLNRLQSFVISNWDNTLSIQNSSFKDFLTNEKACPPRFLINLAEQHTILARCCISIMNQLFQGPKVPEGDHIAYAICHFPEHLRGLVPESRMEFLENVRTFAYSQVAQWLECLFQKDSHTNAVLFIKQVYQWVVSSLSPRLCSITNPFHNQANNFPGETELLFVLKNLMVYTTILR